jgi:hypothetical protein
VASGLTHTESIRSAANSRFAGVSASVLLAFGEDGNLIEIDRQVSW